MNSTGTVAELDHWCSRCLDAGASRDEPLVQLLSDKGCYQQLGSSTSPLSQPLPKYLLAKAKHVLSSSCGVYQDVHAKLLGRAAWAGRTSPACLVYPALNCQDHLVSPPLCKCQALQSHFHQLRKLLFLSVLLIHAHYKLSGLKKNVQAL